MVLTSRSQAMELSAELQEQRAGSVGSHCVSRQRSVQQAGCKDVTSFPKLTELCLELPLPPIPSTLLVLPYYPRSHFPPSPAEPLLSLFQTMGTTFTQALMVLGILQFVLWVDDQTVKVTEELLRQHEEQCSQEMAWLLLLEHMSQEWPKIAQGSLGSRPASTDGAGPLWRCSLCSLASTGCPGSSGYNSSACGEAPAVPRRKRTRRRRKRMRGIADYSGKLHPGNILVFIFKLYVFTFLKPDCILDA
ncbi:hypothetical protein Nmel_012332 [Mimus melanotis]